MTYSTSKVDRFSNSRYSSSLSVVPKLSSTPEGGWFEVCKTYRNPADIRFVYMFESDTLEELKWEVYRELNLEMMPSDFSLTIYDRLKNAWMPIHNDDRHKSIVYLKLPFHSTLNVERHEDKNANQYHVITVENIALTLKLCKQPMNKSDYTCITIDSSKTLRRLKQQAQKEVIDQRTDHLFLWTEGKWRKFERSSDDSTLAHLGFTQDSYISFQEIDHETKLTLKLCQRPIDKSACIHLTTLSSATLVQLKDQAEKQVTNQSTDHLSLWTKDEWIEFETKVEDLTLSELGFIDFSYISFEQEDDLIPGVCGLTNLGNTCFMNSALQCLSNIPLFTHNILSFNDEINAPVIGAYSQLIKTIWSGKHIVTTPSSLLINICEHLPRYGRYRQQDAQEFMNYFLHLIHQEFTNEQTLVTDLFYGQIQSTVKCLGGCRSVETNNEIISFLPLPIENDISKHHVLYLRSNGEQTLVTVHASVKSIDSLIISFIEQHQPTLSPAQIRAVRIANNIIREEYASYTRLADVIKHQLTFIELPEKSVEQRYVECQFVDKKTNKPFRPPVFLVRLSYNCYDSDLSEQLIQLQQHLCSITDAPYSACHFYWVNHDNQIRDLNIDTNRNNMLLFINQLLIEIDSEWVEKYIDQYSFQRSSSNSSLNNLLKDFFQEELLNGDYYCSKCEGPQRAKQKADLLLPLPNVLIIQLKRFTYDTHSDTKIDTYIDFPTKDLDLSPYVIQSSEEKTYVSTLYNLVAVSNHTGSLVSGHYTTYAKNHRNNRWYSFNDEITREILDEKDIVTKNAYILVYVKRTST